MQNKAGILQLSTDSNKKLAQVPAFNQVKNDSRMVFFETDAQNTGKMRVWRERPEVGGQERNTEFTSRILTYIWISASK